MDYVIAGRSLSYCVLRAVEPDVSTPTREIRVASRAGYRIAAWDDGSLIHALGAGLPGPKLVELAHQRPANVPGIRSSSACRSSQKLSGGMKSR